MSDAARAKAEELAPVFGGTPRGDAYVTMLAEALDAFAAEQTAALRTQVTEFKRRGYGCTYASELPWAILDALLADAGQAGEET